MQVIQGGQHVHAPLVVMGPCQHPSTREYANMQPTCHWPGCCPAPLLHAQSACCVMAAARLSCVSCRPAEAHAHLFSTSSADRPVRSAMSSHVSSTLGAASGAAAAAAAAPPRPAAPARPAPADALLPRLTGAAAAERSERADAVRVGRFASGMPSRGPPRRFPITFDCKQQSSSRDGYDVSCLYAAQARCCACCG
jgi:hypothetical protein